MNENIIHVALNGEFNAETDPLWQYDYGQVLVFDDVDLSGEFEAHFGNDMHKDAHCVIGSNNEVEIPDECLRSGKNVLCWIVLRPTENISNTQYIVRIPVRNRPPVMDTDKEIAYLQSMIVQF